MIREIERTGLRMSGASWQFAEQNAPDIRLHWTKCLKKNPALWDGKLVLCERPEFVDGQLKASAFEIDYSSYLAWRDWQYPDRSVFNIFGSALIRSQEGYLIFGIMGAQTAGAGLIYPPAGALERGDVGEGGMLDPVASALRELEEETGLLVPDCSVSGQSDFVSWSGQLISVCTIVQFDRSAKDLAGEIRAFLAEDENSELADIIIIKSVADIDRSCTVAYAQDIAQHLLGHRSDR